VPSPAELRKRGGVVRVRTVRLPNGKIANVYVVRKPGPHGGRTIMGETRPAKRKRRK
jgi:hypothetical protein